MSAKHEKSRGSLHIPLLFLVVLLLGVAGGYYFGMSRSKPSETSLVGVTNTPAVDNVTPSTARIITEAEGKWGSLVVTSASKIYLRGTVQSIESTRKQISDGRNIEGMNITLKNSQFSDTFFVSVTSEVYRGDVKDASTWEKVVLADVKVGDDVDLSTTATINTDTTLDSYVGNWILINE